MAVTVLFTACSTSDQAGSNETVSIPSTTGQATAPTEATTTTETTLSQVEIDQNALAEAKEEIEAAIVGWYTYPTDTSQGDEGLPLDFLTGAMHQRLVDLGVARTAAGEVQRSRGGDAVEVLDIRVDLDTGLADIDVCAKGDHELIDAETEEVLASDDGDAWAGQVSAEYVNGVWLLSNFFSDEENGGNQCVLSE